MTEEIIIDCAFYKDGVCASPINKTCEYCKNIDVGKCYHKQLKRLEQENKELKEQLLEDKILDEHIESLSREDIYRSALEEIREDIRSFYGCEDSSNDYKLINIIDKIDEVLNDSRE